MFEIVDTCYLTEVEQEIENGTLLVDAILN
jgi:hypothetical protein